MKSLTKSTEVLSEARAKLYTIAADEFDRPTYAAIYAQIDVLRKSINDLEALIVQETPQLSQAIDAELGIKE